MATFAYATSSNSLAADADVAFQGADLNSDGVVDQYEFRNFLAGQNIGLNGATVLSSGSTSGLGAWNGASYVVDNGLVGGANAWNSYYTDAGLASNATVVADGGAYDSAVIAATRAHYATDSQGLYQDPNPAVIRRPAIGGVKTYTQNIKFRYLQPPPLPPPGPLIIKEVRPPQPPPPQPLRIRQQARPFPTPPPLVLRERPPIPPAPIASQTVIRRLAGLPVPPRSVVIERIPPAPQRPRDIFVERWVPYGPQAKRRTIVQRAPAPPPYPHPRNVIIQYEQSPARVVRQLHRLGVTAANPSAYVQTYGAQLLDSVSLVSAARSAGVVEDISPPGLASVGYSANTYDFGIDATSGWEGSTVLQSSQATLGDWNSTIVTADDAFAFADTNADRFIDEAEFRKLVGESV
jgi:hypothetical protein